jgi:hypothetical protein
MAGGRADTYPACQVLVVTSERLDRRAVFEIQGKEQKSTGHTCKCCQVIQMFQLKHAVHTWSIISGGLRSTLVYLRPPCVGSALSEHRR